MAKVKEVATRLPMLNVFCLEWSDPPFAAGHWVPEMVEAAAGVNLLSEKAGPSRVVTHREIRDANPEAIVFMPCGYLEEAEEEAAAIVTQELRETSAVRNGNVFAVDATSYFSRPGPRIVDGLDILAWALHSDAYPVPPARSIAGRLSRLVWRDALSSRGDRQEPRHPTTSASACRSSSSSRTATSARRWVS